MSSSDLLLGGTQRISVVIPTWNRREALIAAVHSALAQTLEPLEVLVCDDGSSDGSAEAMAALGDGRVRWLGGPHVGRPAGPRNRGLRAARGQWVAFLDDDDVWLPDKLRVQAETLTATALDSCSSDAFRVGEGHPGDERLLGFLPPRLSFGELLTDNKVICSSLVARRDLLVSLGGFPCAAALTALEDYALWLRLSAHGDIATVDAPLLRYLDVPAASLRAQGTQHAWVARRRVLADLLAWDRASRPSGLDSRQRGAVRKELRRTWARAALHGWGLVRQALASERAHRLGQRLRCARTRRLGPCCR